MKEQKSRPQTASKKPYYRLLGNLLIDAVATRLRLRRFRPLMTNVYITKRCNLRCRYCYPPGTGPDMPLALGLTLLEKIRPGCPAINFTGGEPLLHPDLGRLLEKARELRFQPVLVSTNAYDIDALVPLLTLIDNVVISLDSTSEDINDSLTGIPGSTSSIIENIKALAGLRSRFGFSISLHTVLCADNLDTIESVVALCDQLQLTLSVSPRHEGVYPHPELRDNGAYVHAIRTIMRLKRSGRPVACSTGYLNSIAEFSEHRCLPFLSPRVEPDGTVFFPCYCIRERARNLADYPDLITLMRSEAVWMDAYPDCRRRCFLACYREVERYVSNPLRLLTEIPFRRLTLGRRRRVEDDSVRLEEELQHG